MILLGISYFSVSVTGVRITTFTVSRSRSFLREKKAEADSVGSLSAYQPMALPQGQSGSQGLRVAADLCYFSWTTDLVDDVVWKKQLKNNLVVCRLG